MLSGKAYAEYDVADAAQVVKLPDALRDLDLPLEPFGCAFNIFRRSDIRQGRLSRSSASAFSARSWSGWRATPARA